MFLLPFLIFPIVAVAALDPYWQRRVLAAVILVYLAWLAWRIWRHLPSSPGKPSGRRMSWPQAQEAADFQLRFIDAVRGAGCQVTWSKIVDPLRVGFIVQKGGRMAAVLCLARAAELRAWDLAQLGQWARNDQAQLRAVIGRTRLDPPPDLAADDETMFLSYADLSGLPGLGTLFGGGDRSPR